MSVASRLTNWRDAAAMVVRRKWWAIVPTTMLSTIAVLVALLLPSIYVSETLILIEPREVPDDFVKDLISVDSDRRLNAIRETVLSRSNLLQVYRDFTNQLGPELASMNVDSRLKEIRSKITIDFERPDRRSPIHYFRISFEHKSPETTQQIARRLAELFINYDNQTREQMVFGAGKFLQDEYEKVRAELEDVDRRLAEVKRRYRHELPEQLETNLRMLDRLSEERKTNSESLDRSRSTKLTLERQISETPAVITESVSTPRYPTQERQPSALVEAYRDKERAYQDLSARYTDQHPDVKRAKAELERLRAEIPAEELLEIEESKTGVQTRTLPNPVYQKLVAQLEGIKTEIAIREREKQTIERQIAVYSRRVNSTPEREMEIAVLQRQYDDLKAQADSLKGKLAETRLAESLESRQKGEQFQVVDPASLPLVPSKPNRPLILLLGLLGSVAIGVSLAIGRDLVDGRFFTHNEVERYFGRPLLVEIPQILDDSESRRARALGRARVAAFLLLILTCGAVLAAVYSTPQLRSWGTLKLERVTALLNR